MRSCAHLRRCVASRRRRAASSRTSSRCLGVARGALGVERVCGFALRSTLYALRSTQQVVDEPNEWIEADHVRRVGDEVREGVDVVEVVLAVAVVHEKLDAADVEMRGARDALHFLDDGARWRRPLDAEPRLRCVDGARAAHKLHSVRPLACVRRTKVERAHRREDIYGIEILAVERLDACDVAVSQWRCFLHECRAVDAEAHLVARNGVGERSLTDVAYYPGARSPNVR